MDAERVRGLLLGLPHTAETMQWGENLVFWVGDKAIGGKMFALVALDAAEGAGTPLMSFAAGPERYAGLLEQEDVVPAPYLARAHWVAVLRWDVFSGAEWKELLGAAHGLTLGKLPARTRAVLALPAAEQRQLVKDRQRLVESRRVLAAKEKAQGSAGSSSTAKRRGV